MSKLSQWLEKYHPGMNGPFGPIICRDNGEGSFIEVWPSELGTQPTPEEIEDWTPDPIDPLEAAVAQLTLDFKAAQELAQLTINNLKAKVAIAMVTYAGFTQDAANTEGSLFVIDHISEISSVVNTGGNAIAVLALKNAVEADPRPWLQVEMGPGGPKIVTLFEVF